MQLLKNKFLYSFNIRIVALVYVRIYNYLYKEIYMDFVYNVIIPIVAALLGGLFTFLGVRLTIKNDNAIKKEETRQRNREENKKIIKNCPILEICEKDSRVKYELSMYFLPYEEAELVNDNEITFKYDNLSVKNECWQCKEIYITNVGKKAIQTGFVQLPYKSGFNIYIKEEIESWGKTLMAKNYYSDHLWLKGWLKPKECFVLKTYYPKNEVEEVPLNCYFIDEDGNYWLQECFNDEYSECTPNVISSDEYSMHIRDEYNKIFIFDKFYYNKKVKKRFYIKNFDKILKKRKDNANARKRKSEEFAEKVYNGEILLKS